MIRKVSKSCWPLSGIVILLLTSEYPMFEFLPKSRNLWLNVECSLTRAGDHGELDRAGESDPRGS